MKLPDPRFKRYRLRLRGEGSWPWFGPSATWKEGDLVWGKRVELYEYTYYEPDEMPKSGLKRSIFSKLWGDDKRLEIWGQLEEDGRWVPVSPWLLREQRAMEYPPVSSDPTSSVISPGAALAGAAPLADQAHAACVEALISKLHTDGIDARPEGTYNSFGERGSVDVYHFGKDPQCCVVFEVWTQIDDLNASIRKLDEKARVFPEAHHRTPSRLTRAHFVALATKQNMQVIADHLETFRAKFSDQVGDGPQFILDVFDPIQGDLRQLLPTQRGAQLGREELRRWGRFPSKRAFCTAWQQRKPKKE